jgi:type IV secretion system protein VirB3
MSMGVPLSFFGINMMLSSVGFILFLSLFSKLLVICFLSLPFHAIGYLATEKDPHWMNIWGTKMNKCGPIRNYKHWRCNSYGA